jgi:glycosyltransferase involved in cell wall biosynthesis
MKKSSERPLFQILIPTMPHRTAMLENLLSRLNPQLVAGVELMTDDGPGSIGVKRQRMIDNSTGQYVAFVDDDDMVSDDYVARVLPCLASKPDCVGITMHVKIDGKDWNPSPIFKHSLQFRYNYHWQGQERTPHHLCPLKREIALKSRFSDKMWGEDYDFAIGLLPHLQEEVWSGDEPIYFYEYLTKKGDPPIILVS